MGHRDIPDDVVKRAQLYDREHFRADRAGERGGSWGSVPDDQVRRLLFGAYGGVVPVTVEDESPADPDIGHLTSIAAGEPVVPWEEVRAEAGT